MGAFTESLSYQENVLARMHHIQGHDVLLLASTETFINNIDIGYVRAGVYKTPEGFPVYRIPFRGWLPKLLRHKLRIYKSIYSILYKSAPDVIFLHDCQFYNVIEIVKYLRDNQRVRLYVDSHTDEFNSAKNILSKYVLHRVIYKQFVKRIIPYTKYFYATLPARGRFYEKYYGTPPSKTKYLPMGINPIGIDYSKRDEIRSVIRSELNIRNTDFVFITGGKINKRKNVHILMKAINSLEREDVKLLIFGHPTKEMKDIFHAEVSNSNNKIIYLGWLLSDQTFKYFFSADMAVFPGTHSTLWEEALGLGLPAIFRRWEGFDHVDLKGNCIFWDNLSIADMAKEIDKILNDDLSFRKMKIRANDPGNMAMFNYYHISKKAIEMDD